MNCLFFCISGDREVLDEIPIDEEEVRDDLPEPVNLDEMIQHLQRRQDRRMAREHVGGLQSPRQDAAGPLSPPIRGPRRSGEIEGVRAASGHVPVSQRATPRDIAAWRQRVVVWGLDHAALKYVMLKPSFHFSHFNFFAGESVICPTKNILF